MNGLVNGVGYWVFWNAFYFIFTKEIVDVIID